MCEEEASTAVFGWCFALVLQNRLSLTRRHSDENEEKRTWAYAVQERGKE